MDSVVALKVDFTWCGLLLIRVLFVMLRAQCCVTFRQSILEF